MKKAKLQKLIISGLLILLASCTTVLYTTVDVLKPAKVAFDADATKVLLVNNTVAQPEDYGHITEFYNERARNIKLNTDSLPIFTLSVLAQELQDNEFFNNVSLETNSVNEDKDFFTVNALTPKKVDELCQKYGADVIIALDRLKVNDKISEELDERTYTYYMMLELRFDSYWTIHYPGGKTFQSMNFKDTVYWNAESYKRKRALLELPRREDALIDGALYVGKNTVKRFVPYWDKADRYFFSNSDKYMKQGIDSMYVRSWDAAIDIWKKGLERNANDTKSKLANNISVAYEINGDIENALVYAKMAYEYAVNDILQNYDHYVDIAQHYQDVIERKKEIQLLNTQIGN
ncbi:MAG: DUF6340 family protein [Paludibacter sp.]|nr:DUF6340 family protein [Paludibacter sp.]